nr:hypothetical protein GCM10017745_51110 [Saccharothrix mutabilis subsp. capreolus]
MASVATYTGLDRLVDSAGSGHPPIAMTDGPADGLRYNRLVPHPVGTATYALVAHKVNRHSAGGFDYGPPSAAGFWPAVSLPGSHAAPRNRVGAATRTAGSDEGEAALGLGTVRIDGTCACPRRPRNLGLEVRTASNPTRDRARYVTRGRYPWSTWPDPSDVYAVPRDSLEGVV